MAASTVTVGVIGLGSMGLGVAKTLCRAGFETWGFDVRDTAVLEFEEAGGHVASSPAELGRKERAGHWVIRASGIPAGHPH